MPRLIDADAMIECRVANDPVVIAAKCAPTIDPVKHGRWGHDVLDLSLCSCCLESFKTKATKGFHYCPSCGAKMDGDAHE